MGKQSIKDKIVVVTGSASGIGVAISQRFGKAGAKLGLLDQQAGARRVRTPDGQAGWGEIELVRIDNGRSAIEYLWNRCARLF